VLFHFAGMNARAQRVSEILSQVNENMGVYRITNQLVVQVGRNLISIDARLLEGDQHCKKNNFRFTKNLALGISSGKLFSKQGTAPPL
jgi:hypothetical protein